MKKFFVYVVDSKKFLGIVFANDWIDAKSVASQNWGYGFDQVFTTEEPLPTSTWCNGIPVYH